VMPERRCRLLIVMGLSLSSCIVTPPMTTKTEVIRALDGIPAFGRQAAVHVGQQQLVFRWDATSHAYMPVTAGGGIVNAFRVARLKGDVYLLQSEMEDEADGYMLLPFRVSGAREVQPLACDVPRAAAEEFGVRTGSSEEVMLELVGARPGIIGALTQAVSRCRPQLQIDTFVAMGQELARQGAAAPHGTSEGCRPCPVGACIQGTVRDQSGASIEGARVLASTPNNGSGAPSVQTDPDGDFLLAGLPDGRVELRIELTGFSPLRMAPFQVARGTTYLFDEPFELSISGPSETVAPPRQPRLCTSARKPQ